MKPDLAEVETALPALIALLRGAGVAFKIVGGLAVIHHGYERLTVDIDILVPRDCAEVLAPRLAAHGFSLVSERRLRHDASGVRIDLLREGDILAGPRAAPPLPSPSAIDASETDETVVALPALLNLKLAAGRRQDLTDVVHLLKRVDDGAYVHIEAEVDAAFRAELAELRDEALQELAWAEQNER